MPKPSHIQTPAAVERERDPRRGEAGFTLLELLVVLVILALIAGLAAPRVLKLLGGARSDAAAIQIDTLANILDLYRLELGHYPSEEEGIEALIEPPPGDERWNGPYVRKREQLIDPWGRAFEYRYPGEHGEYDLYSFGADGVEGGDREDADVSSW